MTDNYHDCFVCGRFVFPVVGATFEINSYRGLMATWNDRPSLLAGRVHDACLRTWEHRAAYRRALEHLLRDGSVVYQLRVGDRYETVEQNGFHYTDEMYSDESCQILGNDRYDKWAVLEAAGPVHFIDRSLLEAIGSGKSTARSDDVETVKLPRTPPGDPASWTLPGLLDFFDITDRYEAVLRDDTRLKVWEYFEPLRLLDFSVTVAIPLPDSAITVLRRFASTYVPTRRGAADSH